MIILSILKIIGKIILIILAVLLVLLLLVLFYPVHYKAKGDFSKDTVSATIKGSWLFHILGIEADYREGEWNSYYRILFFRRPFPYDRLMGDSEDASDEEEEDFEEDAESDSSILSAESVITDTREEETKKPGEEIPVSVQEDFEKEEEAEEGTKDETRERKPAFGKVRGLGKSLRNFKEILVSKSKDFGKLKRKGERFLKDPRNKRVYERVKKEFLRLMKILFSGRLKLRLQFSAGNPADTGILLGGIALFPISYKKKWEITPDFEADKAYAEGEFHIEGLVFSVQFFGILFRLILDKDIKRFYRKYMK